VRRVALALVLAAALPAAGCRSWNVDAFGVPVGARTVYATVEPDRAPVPRPLGHHAELSFSSLSKDEKTGVIVVVTLAIASIVAFTIWAN